MSNADQYAQWIVDNQDKKGTDDFNIVAGAYREALAEESNASKKEYGIGARAKSALKSGLEQLPESAAGIGLGLKSAIGMNESAGKQAEAIRAEAAKQKEGPAPITFQELEDTYGKDGAIAALKKLPSYMAEQILQSAPSMAVPLGVAAGAGALSGPFAPIVAPVAGIGTYGLQQFGNFMQRQAQEGATGETLEPGKAAAAAALTAPIGFYADKLTLGLGSIPEKILGKEAAAELARRTSGIAARGAVGAGMGVVAEAPTEVLEQIAERWQAGLPLKDEKAYKEYKEAFFGAAAVGGVGGAGAHMLAGRPDQDNGEPVPLKSVNLAPEEPEFNMKPAGATPVEEMPGMAGMPNANMSMMEQARANRLEEAKQAEKELKQKIKEINAGTFSSNPIKNRQIKDAMLAEIQPVAQEVAPVETAVPTMDQMAPAGASDVNAMPGMTGAPNANMSMMERARANQAEQAKAAEKERAKQIKAIQAGTFHAEPIQNQQIKDRMLAELGVTQPETKTVAEEPSVKKELTPEEVALAEAQEPLPGEGVSPNAGLEAKDIRKEQKQIAQANLKNAPAPADVEEIRRLEGIRAETQKKLDAASKTKGNLLNTLRGQIKVQPGAFGLADLNVDDRVANQLVNKEGRGRLLEDMVADGSLDEYLKTPHSSPKFDAQAAVQEIADKLADKDYRGHIASSEIRGLQEQKDKLNQQIDDLKSLPAANANLEQAAQEQAGVESLSTEDLIAHAEEQGVDAKGIIQDVAGRTGNMTQEQYHGEVRKALISEINGKAGAEVLAQAKGDQKGFTATKEDLKTQAELKDKTMIGVAEWAIKNAPNKFSKFVGEKVLARLKSLEKQGVTLNFKVEDGNRRPNRLYSASGSTEFVWGADGNHTVISIALNGAPIMENQNGYPSGLGYDTIMHELLHAATRGQMRFLASSDPLVKELRTLYNTVVDHFNAEVKAGRITPFMERIYKRNNNALLNPDELISWGLTDKEMQDFLNNIKVGEKTMMDKIVQLVRELLGIAKPFETALDRLVRTTDKLLESDVKTLANGMVVEGYTLGRKAGQQTLFSKKAQALFGEDIFEKRVGKGQPQPTSQGQKSIDLLNAAGRGAQAPDPTYRQKVEESWRNARDNPEATYEHFKEVGAKQISRFKTAVFSSDAAFQDAYEDYVNQMSISDQAKLGLIMQARTSQANHADAVAGVVLEMGSAEFDNETYKWKGVKTKDNFMELRKVLDGIQKQNGYTNEQMDMIYHTALEARQTQQMKQEGKVIHLTDEQIAAGLELFKLNPGLEKAVDVWNGIRKNVMDVMVTGGQYSKEDAAFLLDNADYVPMFREMGPDEEGGPVDSMRGLRAAADKARKGSMRPVNDIFDNQVRWVEYAVSRAVKAHQARTMMDVGVEAGLGEKFNPEVTPASRMKNVVKIWRDGKEESYSMSDPLFMDAFVGLQSVSIPMFKIAAKFANMLRQSIVLYPLFSVAQVSQDSMAAIFTSGLKPQYALRIPVLAVKELIQTMRNKSANHAILKEYGAVGVRDVNSTVVRMDAEAKFALNKDPSIKSKVSGWLNNFAMAADNSVRQAVYQASLDAGKTHSEALEKSFEIFNVRRRGTSKGLALAGQVIPFFPAYLAAQHVAFNVITGKGTSPTQKAEARKVLAQTTASVMVLSMLYAMMNGDDDDYNKKPATQRDRLLMIPGTGGISIPLRADIFLFPKILAEHTYLMLADKGYEDGRKFRDSMSAALSSALASPTAIPQVVKPLVEVGINYDFFQQRPLVGTYQQKLMTERQFTDSTSEFSKMVGQTGLISPIKADHLIRGMFGSFGGLSLWMTNNLIASASPSGERSDLTLQDAIATMPGTSGFVSKSYESALKKDFYTLKEEVDKATNTMNELKTNAPQEIGGFLSEEENIARLGISKSINKVGEDLSKIRKAIRQINNSPTLSGADKQAQIEPLRQAEESLLKGVNVKRMRELGKI